MPIADHPIARRGPREIPSRTDRIRTYSHSPTLYLMPLLKRASLSLELALNLSQYPTPIGCFARDHGISRQLVRDLLERWADTHYVKLNFDGDERFAKVSVAPDSWPTVKNMANKYWLDAGYGE